MNKRGGKINKHIFVACNAVVYGEMISDLRFRYLKASEYLSAVQKITSMCAGKLLNVFHSLGCVMRGMLKRLAQRSILKYSTEIEEFGTF